MICNSCGTENPIDSAVCTKCGADLSVEPQDGHHNTTEDGGESETWMHGLLKNAHGIERLLYYTAGAAFIIALIWASAAIMSSQWDDASGSRRAVTLLMPFLQAIFISGIAVGFAQFISLYRNGEDENTTMMIKVLAIGAAAAFVIGTIVAALTTMEALSHAIYDEYRTQWFLASLLQHSILIGGILAGFAGLIAACVESYKRHSQTIARVLYVVAVMAFIIGIAIAALDIRYASHSDNAPDKVMGFLGTMVTGLLYAAILAGFAGLISILGKQDQVRRRCNNCANDMLDEWKACPYCGAALNGIP